MTVSYVGNQGHRILAVVPVNLGNPALCLSLPGCGPFGEDATYTTAAGQTINGTRTGQSSIGAPVGTGPNYGENTADKSMANSNYNAFQTTLRYQRSGSQFLLSYTFAKSIDQGSNLGEQIDPLNPGQTRAISAWDQKHTFVASYTLALPIGSVLNKSNRLTDDWSLSGTTRFSTGFPVTLYDNSDNSLLGTLGNGVNNDLLDTPQYLPGTLKINTNGRNGGPAFNTPYFPKRTWVNWAMPSGETSTARESKISTWRSKNVLRLAEAKSLEFRLEAFNAFNHAQFYGPASVDGQVEDPNFGQIVSAAAPRLVQLAAKFSF